MLKDKVIAEIATMCACFAASLTAATIPAGTTVAVQTVSSISSNDRVDKLFLTKIDQDFAVNGQVLLKAGMKASGRIVSSRAIPTSSEPLSLELTSISVNGRDVAVKTNSVQLGSPPKTARQARRGFTAGTLNVNPGTKMQFQVAQSLTL